MPTQSCTVTGPSAWASALVNGDWSGLDDNEMQACADWLSPLSIVGWSVVSCGDTERFTWSYRLHGGLADGGLVVDYTLLKAGSNHTMNRS